MSKSKKNADQDANKWQDVADDDAEQMMEDEAKPEGAIGYASHDELEAQLNEMDTKYQKALNDLRYTQAEFENERKRNQRSIEEAHKFATKNLVNDLLPVMDSMKKSVELLAPLKEQQASIVEGVELTQKMLANLFEKNAIKEIDPIDQPFNPAFHEAVSMQEVPGKATGTVIAVLQTGYTLYDRLIRPALVMVAK